MNLRIRALERQKLPDELNQLSGLARPWTWLGVGALTIAVAALVIWSFLGTIPRTASGSGVIAQPGALAAIDSTVSGPVTAVLVNQDAFVQAGQQIAMVGTGSKQRSVTAPFAGQIVGLDIIAGQVVQFGQPLYTIQRSQPLTRNTFVYLFIPATVGAELASGMSVNVTVSTAPSTVFGVLRGTIASVSYTPLSTATVSALVVNPDLARVLTRDGPPMLAQVRLTRDAKTRSGFAWSTPKGPPFPLQPGTQVTAQVVQQNQRPIDVIFGT